MRWKASAFGFIEIDGVSYERDVILDRGKITWRRKRASKVYRDRFGHTPLSLAEDIPWKCKRLVVGSGFEGALPVMPEVLEEAQRRGVQVVVLPTPKAVERLSRSGGDTNAIVHVTC